MKALVENGTVVTVFRKPKAITIDGVTHPEQAMQRWSKEDLLAIGIHEFIEVKPDQAFYEFSEYTDSISDGVVTRTYTPIERLLEDRPEFEEDGVTPLLDEKGNQIITKGLKSNAIAKVKAQANGLLAPSDWAILRGLEDPGRPASVTLRNHRAAIRTKSDDIEAQITACTTLAEFMALHDVPVDADGIPTGSAPINDWPEE